jgi:hypothetical protein
MVLIFELLSQLKGESVTRTVDHKIDVQKPGRYYNHERLYITLEDLTPVAKRCC